MGLSDTPRAAISRELLVAATPTPSRRVLETVRVLMLKDGHGITSHGRRPEEIKPKAGDVLQVSSDLAENWGGAGYCEEVRETAGEAPPEAAAVAEAIDVVPPLAEVVEVVQAPPDKPAAAPPKKRSRGRNKSRR